MNPEIDPSKIRLATLELLLKTVMLTLVNLQLDSNTTTYMWNTFENSLDTHTYKGDKEVEVKEAIRSHGQEIMQSVLRGAGILPQE